MEKNRYHKMPAEKKAILKEYKNLPEEEKYKKKNTEKIDITRCLKKKKQD